MVRSKKSDLFFLAMTVVIVVIVNLLSTYFFTRIDLTKEKRFTLSENTKEILSTLDDEMQVTVYLEGDFPAGFRRLRNSTADLLTDYKVSTTADFNVNFVNPTAGNEQAQEQIYQDLLSKGIEPTPLSVKTEDGMTQKMIFPAALISYKGSQVPVSLLQRRSGATPDEVLNNSIENLEYAFTSAIHKLVSGQKYRVGFTEGHNELSDLELNDAMASLQDGYEVGRIDLSTVTFAGLDKLSLLVVPKPSTEFSEAEKYKIDYFVMKGGSVLWAVDNVNAELDSLRGMSEQLSFPKKLNLDDMLFKYGVRINYDLIADMNCAQIPITVGNVGGQPQIQMLPWLFYPVFVPVVKHPIVRNLDGIKSEFASSIDTIAIKNVRKQVLLSTSPFNQTLQAPTMLSLQMVENEPDPKQFQSAPKIAAVLLEGNFVSVFNNRAAPAELSEFPDLPASGKAAKMIVIGDGDVFKNQVNSTDGTPMPLGYDKYSQQQYGNKNFLLNCVGYLTDNSDLISLRNKEIKLRLLDRAQIRDEKSFWQLFNILIPIILIALFATFQHFYRRRKYAV